MNDQVPISEARANLTELIATVRLQHRTVVLTQRGKPRAAIIPLELLDQLDQLHDTADGLTAMLIPDTKTESA